MQNKNRIEYSKLWRKNNPQLAKKYRLKVYMRYKQKLHQLKINGCAICGYCACDRSLDFHHVNPKDKKYVIAIYTMARKDLVEELNKCILLCRNCHGEIEEKNKKE